MPLMRTHTQYYARSEYHNTQLANLSFDEILDLTAGVYFYFYNKLYSTTIARPCVTDPLPKRPKLSLRTRIFVAPGREEGL